MSTRYQGRYGLAVALALLGLCPNIVLSAAFLPLSPTVAHDLGTSLTTVQLTSGLNNAGYAFGAVLAAALAQRFGQRRLYLAYQALFVVGSVLAATAPDVPVFGVGRVLQGLSAGLMLISALPVLVTRFGVARLPVTVAIVNVGLFGATAVGPLAGALAGVVGWRVLLAAAAVAGAAGLVTAWLGYAHLEPLDPDLPFDVAALGLALVSVTTLFTATSVLTSESPGGPAFLVPFAVGLVALVGLVLLEYRKQDALMPVEALSTQLPVTGTLVAMGAGAVVVTVVELDLTFLMSASSPVAACLAFWPMPLGVLLGALAFGITLRTRWLPVLVDVGLLLLAAAVVLSLRLPPGPAGPPFSAAAFLLGLGAAATVSPGLFLAGFGVPSTRLGRAFALVQLLRSSATYAVAPLVLAVVGVEQHPASGLHEGLLAMLALTGLTLLAAVLVPALSGARLRRPDLEGWLEHGEQALSSPLTGVHLRPHTHDDQAAPLVPRIGAHSQRRTRRE